MPLDFCAAISASFCAALWNGVVVGKKWASLAEIFLVWASAGGGAPSDQSATSPTPAMLLMRRKLRRESDRSNRFVMIASSCHGVLEGPARWVCHATEGKPQSSLET